MINLIDFLRIESIFYIYRIEDKAMNYELLKQTILYLKENEKEFNDYTDYNFSGWIGRTNRISGKI